MKWIFVSLLVMNIGYFVYQVNRPDVPVRNDDTKLADQITIELLSEKKGTSSRDVEVAEILENPVSADSVIEDGLCRGLGPFENVISAQDVAERFTTFGMQVDLRAVDRKTGDFDYRVVLPPLNSLQEAFRRLRELKSRGIDSYVISQGEDAQGISLGVFSSGTSASNYRQKMVGLGYPVVIKEIPRIFRGYWIFNQSSEFPANILESVKNEFSGVDLTETACLN